MKPWKKYLAEFIGTFVLVFVACGTAVAIGCDVNGGYLATAAAFGLVIVAMAYSIGNVSGCHINPAVSVAVLINGGMSVKDFIGYVIAQFAGATAGAAVLGGVLGSFEKLGQNGYIQKVVELTSEAAEGTAGFTTEPMIFASLLVEILLTCIFVLAVLGATSKKENSNVAGLVIGGSLTLVHLLGIFLTGTSVNPARSFGPALLAGGDAIASYWVFLVGPMVGGVIAALLWKFVLNTKEEEPVQKKK
jgi:aquaporin Z